MPSNGRIDGIFEWINIGDSNMIISQQQLIDQIRQRLPLFSRMYGPYDKETIRGYTDGVSWLDYETYETEDGLKVKLQRPVCVRSGFFQLGTWERV